MRIKQFEIWVADLNPQIGTESGKRRPVLVLQTNLLNQIPHPSTIICPLTSKVIKSSKVLRVHLRKGTAGLNQDCDLMIDQLRAVDNRRLVKKIGSLSGEHIEKVKENIKICLDLN